MRKPLTLLKGRRPRRSGSAPSEQVARIGWVLLRLLYDQAVEYAAYCDHFGRSKREFQRDLGKLREIGRAHFTISRMKSGRVLLHVTGGAIAEANARGRTATATLSRIAAALGGPLEHELLAASGVSAPKTQAGFLHLREPLPVAGERVTRVFQFLKAAAGGPARVEFHYSARDGKRTVRRVEPYHVVSRAGRYYLIAYDIARKDWRHFALDAIEERSLRKEGTFTPRAVPEPLLAERAVGWIRGSHSTTVTVGLNPVVAGTIASRSWQQEQRVEHQPDGSAEMTLSFDDLAEAVRWSLQFGPDAVIVAPPEAVALARDIISQLGRAYESASQPRRIAG